MLEFSGKQPQFNDFDFVANFYSHSQPMMDKVYNVEELERIMQKSVIKKVLR